MNKISILKQIGFTALVISAAISLSACVAAAVGGAAAAGGAGAAFYMGTLRVDIQAMPSRIAAATRSAFQVLSIKVDEFKATELDARIVGHSANDEKITVKVHRETDSISELSIHVGVFGDESMSNLIYEEIKRQLQGGSQGVSAGVSTYAVPMEATPAPTSAAAFTPAPPTLEPAQPNPPATSTPSPSTGTPMAY